MLCPVLHNWLRVAGAVFLVLEITEVAEITDNRGDTETRRMRVAAGFLPAATRIICSPLVWKPPRLRVSAVIRDIRHLC